MDFKFKKCWADTHICSDSEPNMTDLMNGRRRTALQRLAERYKRFSRLGLLMCLWSVCYMFADVFPARFRLGLCLFMLIYFGTVSCMDHWLYQGVRSIDCVTMTVREVVDKALFYRKRHLQFVAILILPAAAFIAMLAYAMSYNNYAIGGVVIGGVTGLIVGSRQLMNFMADYRTLRE